MKGFVMDERQKNLIELLDGLEIAQAERPCASKKDYEFLTKERTHPLTPEDFEKNTAVAQTMNLLTFCINTYYWSGDLMVAPMDFFELFVDDLKGDILKKVYEQIQALPADTEDMRSMLFIDLVRVASKEFDSAGIDRNEAFENSWYTSGDYPGTLFDWIWNILCSSNSFNPDSAIEFYFKRVYQPEDGVNSEEEWPFWELLRDKLIEDTKDLSFLKSKTTELILAGYSYLTDADFLELLVQKHVFSLSELSELLTKLDPEYNEESILAIQDILGKTS